MFGIPLAAPTEAIPAEGEENNMNTKITQVGMRKVSDGIWRNESGSMNVSSLPVIGWTFRGTFFMHSENRRFDSRKEMTAWLASKGLSVTLSEKEWL